MEKTNNLGLYKKLYNLKSEIGAISKDSKNPFFQSKYFDINSLLQHTEPLLNKHGLLLLQPIENGIQKTVIIDVDSGDSVESGLTLGDIKDPQKRGSEITYFRRYTATSLLGLQAEDDDGNRAAKPTPPRDYTRQQEMLKACNNLKQLAEKYLSLTPEEKTATLKLKDELKLKLS